MEGGPMLSDARIRRESASRLFLSKLSEDEKTELEIEILGRFSEPGGGFPLERMDGLHLLIRRLGDCGYLRCGVNGDLEETYGITESGMAHLRYLKSAVNR